MCLTGGELNKVVFPRHAIPLRDPSFGEVGGCEGGTFLTWSVVQRKRLALGQINDGGVNVEWLTFLVQASLGFICLLLVIVMICVGLVEGKGEGKEREEVGSVSVLKASARSVAVVGGLCRILTPPRN